jgi:hypothetical protein
MRHCRMPRSPEMLIVVANGGNFQFDGGSVAFSGGSWLSLLRYGAMIGGASVTVSGTVAVSGSYSDSFALSSPGSLFLGISDHRGTLSRGFRQQQHRAEPVDLNAILASLHYTASGSPGSDPIDFDVEPGRRGNHRQLRGDDSFVEHQRNHEAGGLCRNQSHADQWNPDDRHRR